MGIETQKYLRKPLYVNAVRVTEQNFDEIVVWCQGEMFVEGFEDQGGKRHIKVRVHNPKNIRQTKAFVGDWILYTERGYKVYTNKAFLASFDLVTAETAQLSDPRLTGDPVVDRHLEHPLEPNELAATPAVIVDEPITVEDAPEQEKVVPAAVEGKRVLSIIEQETMTSDEIRALIQSGEAVLAQDIAEPTEEAA